MYFFFKIISLGGICGRRRTGVSYPREFGVLKTSFKTREPLI